MSDECFCQVPRALVRKGETERLTIAHLKINPNPASIRVCRCGVALFGKKVAARYRSHIEYPSYIKYPLTHRSTRPAHKAAQASWLYVRNHYLYLGA